MVHYSTTIGNRVHCHPWHEGVRLGSVGHAYRFAEAGLFSSSSQRDGLPRKYSRIAVNSCSLRTIRS